MLLINPVCSVREFSETFQDRLAPLFLSSYCFSIWIHTVFFRCMSQFSILFIAVYRAVYSSVPFTDYFMFV